MSLTTRERGAYTRAVGAYIRMEKCITNLGGLYSEELMQERGGGGGGLFTEFYGNVSAYKIRSFYTIKS